MVNNPDNSAVVRFESQSINVAFARMVVTAFLTPLDPTVAELSDIKTAVSEAVTNAIIHGYGEGPGEVCMRFSTQGRNFTVVISDEGVGIENIDSAREPLFTTKPDMERSGLGFTVMESFMDTVEVTSTPGAGTTITLTKTLGGRE